MVVVVALVTTALQALVPLVVAAAGATQRVALLSQVVRVGVE